MNNKELYINNQLISLGKEFSLRLNRVLLNPGELNTKDSQYSYNIALPPTELNHRAFKFSNVEETRDKFNRTYTAELIVNSVRIFKGYFRLSEISAKGYKGNLYIPAKKSIKDIFGDIKLNQNPEYRIDFVDFVTYVNLYNNLAADGPIPAIFPFTLYGLLAKLPLLKNVNNYSARDLWDASVRYGMQDLPPSINPLIMLKHIFNAQGYALQGTAFDDVRLTNLYMSYRNADDYVQPWNYGQHAKMQLNGIWQSTHNQRAAGIPFSYERGVNQSSDETGIVYSTDLFDCMNSKITITEDTGGNILYKEIDDVLGNTWVNCQIRIPASGYYKVKLNTSIKLPDVSGSYVSVPDLGIYYLFGESDNADNFFTSNIYEMRLLRDRKAGDFGLQGAKIDGNFYRNNQPQNHIFNGENVPKYFPVVGDGGGQLHFIDAAQDNNMVVGFNWGRHNGLPDFVNPRDLSPILAQMQAAKPALSWDTTVNPNTLTRLGIATESGYWKYGKIGTYDNPGDNPDIDIDYSAGPFDTGDALDSDGNPESFVPGELDIRTNGYWLNPVTGFPEVKATWQISDIINLDTYSALTYTAVVEDGEDTALIAFYDINNQYIGYQLLGPTTGGGPVTYTALAVAPPSTAIYVRFAGITANTMTIDGTPAIDGNIILWRFPIDRFYTYTLTTDPMDNYEGYAFVHDGTNVTPLLKVPFVGGVVSFNTGFAALPFVEPRLTIYLKTPDFDVDGTLIISRSIQNGNSDEVIDWELTNKYYQQWINAPFSYCKRGQYDGSPDSDLRTGQGEMNAVVWLDAGELLTVASVSSDGRYRDDGMHSAYGLVDQIVKWSLSVQPFRVDYDWLKVALNGNGTEQMDWNDPVNFDIDSINLVGFLNADMKTDDFIDNFCKAFNLNLSQLDASTFSLDVKQSKTAVSNLSLDLDKIASVKERVNSPLGIPSLYKLGFTIDPEEEGYTVSGDDGGGQFETGSTDISVVEQRSNFSYNWYKNITKDETPTDVILPLAVISKHEVWTSALPYPEAMLKRYTDLAYRFWYYDGLLNDLGATFSFNGASLDIAKVSEDLPGLSILNYKNKPYTILDNFFTVLINGSSHYTELEAYLTAAQYRSLDGAILGKYNGDLYYIAELSGYDPDGRNKTVIKLIRKI